MGKGDRKKKPQLPKVKSPVRKKRGRARMAEIHDDATEVVCDARARHLGLNPNNPEVRAAMRHQMLETPGGAAVWLFLGCNHNPLAIRAAARLYQIYAGLTAAEYNYQRRILGRTAYAKTARLESMPDPIQTRADDQTDLRTADERDRDTVARWMRWQGHMGHIPGHQQTAIWDIVRERQEPVRDGRLTMAGDRFVRALDVLAGVVEKRKS